MGGIFQKEGGKEAPDTAAGRRVGAVMESGDAWVQRRI